jgi:succinoglycan biosynthesis transport protein ExoP
MDDNTRQLGGGFNDPPVVVLRNASLPDLRSASLNLRAEDDLGDDGFDLGKYLHTLRKHWKVILAVVVASVAIAAAITFTTQKIYTASVTLQIDKEVSQVVDVQALEPREQTSYDEFFQTQYGLIKSESLASRTVDRLRLVDDAAFLKATGFEPAAGTPAAKAALRQRITDYIVGNVDVAPIQRSRLVRVTFSSPDRLISAKIANALAENYIGSNLDRRFEASSYARKFLQERIDQTRAKLEQSERQLVQYAREQQIITVPTGGGDSESGSSGEANSQPLAASSLGALNEALTVARAERIRAEQRWRQSLATGGSGTLNPQDNPNIRDLSLTRAKLESDYQEKLETFLPDHPEMLKLRARIKELDRQIQAENSTSNSSSEKALRAQYDVALRQERSFEAQVNGLKSSVLDARDRGIQYEIFQRDVDTNRTLYEGLLQRYKEIGVAGGLSNNNVSIIDRAKAPKFASQPQPRKNMITAVLVGLLVGIGLAFLIEFMDESIRSPQDVESKLGLPLLGSIPKLDKGIQPMDALQDARSSFSEAYYSVQTALQFSSEKGMPRSLAILSARPSEGKSTSSLAVARNVARLGGRVLLIDSDLRNPSLHRLLGSENSRGLSNYLSGDSDIQSFVSPTAQPNLFFMSSGPIPPDPAQLLASRRLVDLIRDTTSVFDLVLFDAPPVMGLADAPLIASRVEASLLIVEAGRTGRRVVRAALSRLRIANARVLGVLLTKFDARHSSYGYGYGYGYGSNYDYTYGDKSIEDQAATAARQRKPA